MDIDNYKEIKLADLEKENTKNKNIINDLLTANKKLIQKNEELKEKIKKYSNINEQDTKDFVKYKQALDEIVQAINNFPFKGIQDISQTQTECTSYFLSVSEAKLQKILGIIRKAKEQ